MERIKPLILVLLLAGCAYPVNSCPQRPKFTGKTYEDLLIYNHDLEDLYDACVR